MAYTIDTLAPDFSATLVNGEAVQLKEMIKTQSVCIIFLRFLGCPLTRLRLAELEKEIETYEVNELKLIVVFESTVARTEKYMTRKGLTMDIIVDEQRKLYDLFDVQPGGLKTMFNPNMLKKAGEATIKGHMHGAFEGNELQLPAAFIINKEQKFSYVNYGEHPGDAVATDSILLNMTA